MNSDSLGHFNNLPLATRYAIDRLCTRFEAAWRNEENPSLETYLGEVPPEQQAAVLTELLALDLEYRRHRGESPEPQTFTSRFPHLGSVVQEVFAFQGRP